MTNWNVVVQEPGNAFSLHSSAVDPCLEIALPSSNAPNRIRTNFFDLLPNDTLLTPELLDLTMLSMVVYSSDTKIPRDISSDRWTRKIRIYMPVTQVSRWQAASKQLEDTLRFLSGDEWQFEFRKSVSQHGMDGATKQDCDAVCLLSGGLDSLVGAIDLLANSKRVALVGHHGAGITNTVQQNVLAQLQGRYGKFVEPFNFYVQAPSIANAPNEQTMRARSFLFICLGLATVHCVGKGELTVPENGFISLNVPLTSARIGSMSTRTTHPYFIESLVELLRKLAIPLKITLPYQFLTKGEMIAAALDQQTLWRCIPKTMSCTHPESGRYAGKSPTNHCGYCVPCIIRRAALRRAGKDPTKYNVSIKRKPPDCGTGRGRDLRAFLMAVERYKTRKPHQVMFDVLASGPLEPLRIGDFVDLYRRGMAEVTAIL